ncbi:MAG: hypothetical protein OXH69_02635 [Acidobacteria bacterium]|nr:hypothetical protein [Acidobacteriota bacterium]
MVESYQQVAVDGAAEDQFSPDGYAIVDLIGFASLMEDLTFRLGLLNLTDANYFEWWNVRGRPADDPVIDRYSSPGISLVVHWGTTGSNPTPARTLTSRRRRLANQRRPVGP